MIINLSPHRSGTKSFDQWCQAHELKTQHYMGWGFDSGCDYITQLPREERPAEIFKHYRTAIGSDVQVVGDVPVPTLLNQFLEEGPEKHIFLMLLRDPFEWARAVRGQMCGRLMTPLEQLFYDEFLPLHTRVHVPVIMNNYSEAELARAYVDFTSKVYFKMATTPGAVYRSFTLNDPCLADRLTEFLFMRGAPSTPFPFVK